MYLCLHMSEKEVSVILAFWTFYYNKGKSYRTIAIEFSRASVFRYLANERVLPKSRYNMISHRPTEKETWNIRQFNKALSTTQVMVTLADNGSNYHIDLLSHFFVCVCLIWVLPSCFFCRCKEKMKENSHFANVYVPVNVATILKAKPSLVSSAVQSFYYRDPLELKVINHISIHLLVFDFKVLDSYSILTHLFK